MADSIRNVAIIAHVDHGKTTLVDAMLAYAGVFREGAERVDCVLDSHELERERGITVLSKNCAVRWGGMKVNVIDTPGHADFGGEVERVLRMADGALLLVDAFEGPMPQTRHVLRKAFEAGLSVLVVINKCDRPHARPDAVLDLVFDLFVELGADDEQLDFPVLYASGREGWVRRELDDGARDPRALFEAIRDHVPAPEQPLEGPARLQVTTIDHNDFVGRIAIGRVDRGVLRDGAALVAAQPDGTRRAGRLAGLFVFSGLGREPVGEARAGDLVAVQGFGDVRIGETLCDPDAVEPLPAVAVDEPTIAVELRVNDSPFAGREGRFVTGRQLADRLRRELRSNVALRVEDTGSDSAWRVCGRGTLHLGILIEQMRREGYELAVSRPRVIDRVVGGRRHEPVEELTVDVPAEHAGRVIELVGTRRGDLIEMTAERDVQRLVFRIPARGLIGLRTRLLNATQGEAVMNHVLAGYEPFRGGRVGRGAGVLVAADEGVVTSYALDALAARGDFFVEPGDRVYVGMIVGEHCKPNDIPVSATRGRKLSNVRNTGSERALKVPPPRRMSLEEALEYIADDELVEVTPSVFRLRKALLDEKDRKRAARRSVRVRAG